MKQFIKQLERDIEHAVRRAVRAAHRSSSGQYVGQLEQELTKFFGGFPVVSVSSGTDGLILAMKALGIGRGDEVIVPAFSFVATASSVVWTGAVPVFADIRNDDYALDPECVEECITRRTKAIVVAHLFGQPASRMADILRIARRASLYVIEDAAQSFGGRIRMADGTWRLAGSVGDVGCFSFSQTKPFGAYGNGGAVISRHPEIVKRITLLRHYGGFRPYREIREAGINASLADLAAVVILTKFAWRNEIAAAYHALAGRYCRGFAKLPQLQVPLPIADTSRVWYRYPVRTKECNDLFGFLKQRLKEHRLHPMLNYPVPLPHLEAFRSLRPLRRRNDLRISEAVASELLALPMSLHTSERDARTICSATRSFFSDL